MSKKRECRILYKIVFKHFQKIFQNFPKHPKFCQKTFYAQNQNCNNPNVRQKSTSNIQLLDKKILGLAENKNFRYKSKILAKIFGTKLSFSPKSQILGKEFN